MKIHEDRSHMNIDTRWFEKGYIKEDVHSLRLQSLCTEAEAAANKQFYDSHTREEWDQYIRQASLESSAAMKPVMEAIAQDFVCYQYDENIPVSYGSDRWDLYFWCNPFNGAADASERDRQRSLLPLPACCGLCLRPHLYPDSVPDHGALRVPPHG